MITIPQQCPGVIILYKNRYKKQKQKTIKLSYLAAAFLLKALVQKQLFFLDFK